jgi:hypothetical protein
MAITNTNILLIPACAWGDPPSSPRARSKHISLRAARAIRILRHAIEYLADEFFRDAVPPSGQKERLQAVRLLMSLNREVYNECPEVSALAERFEWVLRLRRA